MADLKIWFLQWVYFASSCRFLITEAAPEQLPHVALAPSYALHFSISISFFSNKDKIFSPIVWPVGRPLMCRESKNISYIMGRPFWKVT